MRTAILVFWFLFVNVIESKFYKSNITDDELRTCTIYYSRTGSVYKDFFVIKNPPTDNDTMLLDFHFSVLAASDAHILLAPSESISKGDPAYEIVIGAGGNTFSDIRRQQKAAVKQSVRRNGLLSAVDVKTFWMHISKDGVIEVGIQGEELPFISWIDPDPLPLKVFSFSAWSGIEAKWFFDCKRDEDNNEHFQKLKRNLTHLEQLRQDLLNHYNPYVRPVQNMSSYTDVNMSLSTYDVHLDEKKGIVEVKGESRMKWMDEKLIWNSSNYGDLNALHIFRREIWQPDLVLYNAFGNGRNIIEDSLLVVQSNGLVEWNASITLKAWCDAHNVDHWPKDSHKCNFILGFLSDFDKMTLNFNENDSFIGYRPSSEWDITSVDILTNLGWEQETFDPAVLQLSLVLKRTNDLYSTIFFTPYLVIAVSMLITFWVSPFGPMKISLGCLELLMSSAMLLGLAIIIPNHSENIPYLVLLYSYSLIGSLISILLSIIVINLSRNQQQASLPHFVIKLLTSSPLKISLCLCLPSKKSNDEYDKLSESSFKKYEENQQEMWILLGVTIDRISFLIYLSLIIYSIFISY